MSIRFDLSHDEGVAIVTLPSKLIDSLLIRGLAGEILAWLENETPERVVFDFQHVRRMSSEAINLALSVRKQMAKFGGRLVLCGMAPDIREVFRLVKLDGSVFDIREDLPRALHSLEVAGLDAGA